MDRTVLLRITIVTALVCIMVGLVSKILHYQYSLNTIIVGIIAAILFTTISLFEIWSSKTILIAEKLMWTTGFVAMSGVTGLLYFFIARKRILRKSPLAYR